MTTEDMDIAGQLADQLDRLLTDRVDAAFVASSERKGLDRPFWNDLESLGASLLLVPAEQGGAGVGWAGAERAMRLTGYHVAPAPVGETMVAAELIASAGIELPEGPIALFEGLLSLEPDGTVACDATVVAWGGDADHLVAIASLGSERRLCVFARESIDVLKPADSIGRIPAHTVALDGKVPGHCKPIAADLDIFPRLAVLRSLQIAGALERILELSIEYAGTRVQFGKPIARFQAIQHLLAQLAEETAAAQVAAVYGARSIDRGDGLRGASIAKTRAGMAATRGSAFAHQIFGAIGVTSEHALHFYTRRLWQWRSEAGSEHFWAERLGRSAIEAGSERLWADISRR